MQNLQLSSEGRYGKALVKIDVPVILFEEEGVWYAFMPSFDLTGYGNSSEEAKESLGILLNEFVRYTLNKNTFFNELERLGWKIRSKKKPFIAPRITDLIKENEQLKEIIDTKQYTTSKYEVSMPQPA